MWVDELESKARGMNIFELRGFFESREFREGGYGVDLERGVVRREVASA